MSHAANPSWGVGGFIPLSCAKLAAESPVSLPLAPQGFWFKNFDHFLKFQFKNSTGGRWEPSGTHEAPGTPLGGFGRLPGMILNGSVLPSRLGLQPPNQFGFLLIHPSVQLCLLTLSNPNQQQICYLGLGRQHLGPILQKVLPHSVACYNPRRVCYQCLWVGSASSVLVNVAFSK